jgi:hypothetical protein
MPRIHTKKPGSHTEAPSLHNAAEVRLKTNLEAIRRSYLTPGVENWNSSLSKILRDPLLLASEEDRHKAEHRLEEVRAFLQELGGCSA